MKAHSYNIMSNPLPKRLESWGSAEIAEHCRTADTSLALAFDDAARSEVRRVIARDAAADLTGEARHIQTTALYGNRFSQMWEDFHAQKRATVSGLHIVMMAALIGLGLAALVAM